MVEPGPSAPVENGQIAPGTPISWTDPGGSVVVIDELASSPDPEPIIDGSVASFDITTAVAGDIIFLTDPNGGNDPSNWGAVLRFLNPNDPTGSLGLAATDIEAFVPGNAGPNGFADFTLFPNAIDAANPTDGGSEGYSGTLTEFGPADGIPAGQTASLIYTAVPEPGTTTLLNLGVTMLTIGAGARRLRRKHASTPSARLPAARPAACPGPPA